MTVQTLLRKQRFPLTVSEVFTFFEAPENLALITPRWLDFRMLTPSPVVMKEGALIDYTIRWGTFPIRWTSLITEYQRPYRFVDVQIKGPYSLWHHTHSFVEKDGWTEMMDEVRYVLPFGMFGSVAHALLVRTQLNGIFDYRARIIGDLLQHPSAPSQ